MVTWNRAATEVLTATCIQNKYFKFPRTFANFINSLGLNTNMVQFTAGWRVYFTCAWLFVWMTEFGLCIRDTGRDPKRGYSEQRLLKNLLGDYDTDARGVAQDDKTVTVNVMFLLLRIQGLDERSQILTTTGLIITDWFDERLTWNPQDYGNLTDVVLHPLRVWRPELALMNGAVEQAPDFKRIRLLVQHDGHVHWEPGGVFSTTCDINIQYFPFDHQTCVIQLGAWAYYSAKMNMTNADDSVVTHQLSPNVEWLVAGTLAEWKENILPCCPKTRYPYVEFSLVLHRRHTFYVMNIVLPCSMLSILVMIVFCLPPGAGEKISLGISVLLAYTVFLLMVAENIPRTSLHIPIIVIYLTCTMALGALSVIFTTVVLNMHYWNSEIPMPPLCKLIMLNYVARALCVRTRKHKYLHEKLFPKTRSDSIAISIENRSYKRTQLQSDESMMNSPKQTENGRPASALAHINNEEKNEHHKADHVTDDVKRDNARDWQELALVLDRLFFWIVFFLMSGSAMIILLVPFYRSSKT